MAFGVLRTIGFLTAILLALFLVGCSEDDDNCQPVQPGDPPVLVVSPDSLVILDSDPNASLFMSTNPPGSVTWQVSSKPNWIQVNPDSGLVGESIIEIEVSADNTGLQPSTYIGKIEIISTGGEGEVGVAFGVNPHPIASLSVSSLEFNSSSTETSFELSNTGTGLLQWTISASENWLTFVPASGNLSAGSSVSITARVNRSGMDVGSYTATVTVESNSDGGDVDMPASMDVPASPLLEVSTSAVFLDYFVDTDQFTIRNVGNAPFSWNGSADETFVTLDQTSGTINGGDSVVVTASAVRTGLGTGSYGATITIDTDASQSENIAVTLNNYEDALWALDYRVVDSEFDRNADVIVTVSSSPNRLHKLEPETRAVQSVELSLTPACVSIRPDGAYAAV
ncbi:MAG: BACON domain-containing protein, partial [Candidatus Latescibacterota bacterium]